MLKILDWWIMKKTVVFINGQSLHYALSDFGLQEKDINWEQFLKYIMPSNHELIRGYCYHPARVVPFDFSPLELKKNCPESMNDEEYKKNREEWIQEQVNRLKLIQDVIHRRLQLENNFIEFIYAGSLRINPYNERFEEKGVNVAIGLDMVTRLKGYDSAILISNDIDLLPAISYIKRRMKYIYQFVFSKDISSNSSVNSNSALAVAVDVVLQINESEFKNPKNRLLR